jgi:hypothetical protein
LSFSACKKEESPTPNPVTTANIIGSVVLYTEGAGNGPVAVDKSGMTVRIEGGTSAMSTTTDMNGEYILSDVPFGTYNVIFEKSGFGTYKEINVEHINTGSSTVITKSATLSELSTTTVTDITATINLGSVVLMIDTDPPGFSSNIRYIRYFLSASSGVSNEDYSYVSEGFTSQTNPKEVTISQSDLLQANFSSGDTVFVKAYGDSHYSNEYEDPSTNLTVFPNLNPASAAAVSFIVP